MTVTWLFEMAQVNGLVEFIRSFNALKFNCVASSYCPNVIAPVLPPALRRAEFRSATSTWVDIIGTCSLALIALVFVWNTFWRVIFVVPVHAPWVFALFVSAIVEDN